jgi:para-aminobenzoate synthetase component 1
MQRFELLDEPDYPFPLGGCIGYWGYDLRHFTEPRLRRETINDLALPDCSLGFYDSLMVFDHVLQKSWIVSTGLLPDGTRSQAHAIRQRDSWLRLVETSAPLAPAPPPMPPPGRIRSNLSRTAFIHAVSRAQEYIRQGHIYQVNLSHRLSLASTVDGWDLFLRLLHASPAPHAAFLEGKSFQVASASPELFLRLSGPHIRTRPIKGTRPRSADAAQDARLMCELQTSSKELAELVMITDLLRNDLGRVCEYGTVQVPELARLERFPQVQHLVSTVEGRLREEVTHLDALESCFPGGSITGAPKIRAMEIIDELEPLARGLYTGGIGCLGFNRESQLNIAIRTALCHAGQVHFHVGAGIVADSVPEAEYQETLAKAAGFFQALNLPLDCNLPFEIPAHSA